jgi:GH25 family lysozyme M1 (1,4-beta-N-acetylmuramidase)
MPNPVVVDISHWNPTPDWAKLKADGTVGVIHKATEGTGNSKRFTEVPTTL